MNLHISYKSAKTPDVEREFQHQVRKLERRLQVFRPELVSLHGIVEQNSGREGTLISLNLRLPSGQMATQEAGSPPVAAVKQAFSELLQQLVKHKELLRGQRHRHRGKEAGAVPFETTVAAVHPPAITDTDVRDYLSVNLSRLERYIEREIRHRENSGALRREAVSGAEVIDEAIANALGDDEERPEVVSLERWMYRLATRAINKLSAPGEQVTMVHLEDSVRRPNVRASDEAQLQFHQPDEAMTAENVIADRSVPTPEEVAYSDEMVALIETALKGARPQEREAFILSALEGFTVKEIAAIAERDPKLVESDIQTARERLRKALPASAPLRHAVLRSKTA